jgi:hypothetical protein
MPAGIWFDSKSLYKANFCAPVCAILRKQSCQREPTVSYVSRKNTTDPHGRIHWSIEDPAAATGDDAAKLAVFRRVRDEIRDHLTELAKADQQI